MKSSRRRPFWLPASNYYFLAAAGAVLVFVVVWGVLHDEDADAPLVIAGVAASGVMVIAVLVCEFVLRPARNRRLAVQDQLDQTIAEVYSRVAPERRRKLTLEQHADLLDQIKRRSEVADTLNRFAAPHREVFEMCGEYLAIVENELTSVRSGSPRLTAFRRGRDSVKQFHRYHMLQWAAIESRSLTTERAGKDALAVRAEGARNALDIVETALGFYPDEPALNDSRQVIQEMLISIKVSDRIEQAERAEADGDLAAARNLYRDVLFYLGRDGGTDPEKEWAAERIYNAIEHIRQLEGQNGG